MTVSSESILRALRTSAGALACLLLLGCGGSTVPAPTRSRSTTSGAGIAAAPTGGAPVAGSARSRGGDGSRQRSPGSLPQIRRFPVATGAGFAAEMAALWQGVETGSAAVALPAFFPEGAYAQVKAIADPGADYVGRLVREYRLDLAAAHGLLGAQPNTAQLVGVEVPRAYGHWVAPATCFNRVGYYEVPNSRVVYRQGGQVRSFGIASMISWRGVWYVVHLGAVVRSSGLGVVDEPTAGKGVPAASATC